MATLKKELRDILDRYGIDPRDKSQIWDCHGTLVLYHKAFEVIAAKEKIDFEPPIVLEARGADKSVALCVVGHMGERREWATGEASPANNKNAYPFAMAEKRAKDRCVAKLVGLAQYVYSEDEAEDFKTGERKSADDTPPPPPPKTEDEPWRTTARAIAKAIDASPHLVGLNNLMEQKGVDPKSKDPRTGSDLEFIRSQNAESYAFLLDRAQKKRGQFLNEPGKAA